MNIFLITIVCLVLSVSLTPVFAGDHHDESILFPSDFSISDRTHLPLEEFSFQFTAGGNDSGNNIWSVSSDNCSIVEEDIDGTGLFTWTPTAEDTNKTCAVIVIIQNHQDGLAARDFELFVSGIFMHNLVEIKKYNVNIEEDQTIPSLSTVVMDPVTNHTSTVSKYRIITADISRDIIDSLDPNTGDFSKTFPYDAIIGLQDPLTLTFSWSYNDGTGESDPQHAIITLDNRNREPIINPHFPPIIGSVHVNQRVLFNFTGSDPDGDDVTWSMARPIKGVITGGVDDGSFMWIPRSDSVGVGTFMEMVLTDVHGAYTSLIYGFETSPVEFKYLPDGPLDFDFPTDSFQQHRIVDTISVENLYDWNILNVTRLGQVVEDSGITLTKKGVIRWFPNDSMIGQSFDVDAQVRHRDSDTTTRERFSVNVVDETFPVITFNTELVPESPLGTRADFVYVTDNDPNGLPLLTCERLYGGFVGSGVSIGNGSPLDIGTHIITCTAIDASLNRQVTVGTVTVAYPDPMLLLPPDVVTEATGPLTVVELGTATVSDDVDLPSITNDAPDSFPVGTTTITWTATGDAARTVIGTQTVTVRDTAVPTIVIPDDIIAEATGQLTDVNLGSASATDVADADVTITHNAPDSFPLGLTAVIYIATDDSDNFVVDAQIVSVRDTTKPVIIAPKDITFVSAGMLSMINLGTATATDIVDDALTITNNAPNSFPIGTTTITWTATDDSGNSATAIQTVTVKDSSVSVLILPSDVVAEATGPLTVVDIGTATATDSAGSITATNNAPDAFPIGITTVTWTATDSSEHILTGIQTVTVRDTVVPTIVIPDDIIAEALSSMTGLDIGSVTATDTVDSDVAITNDAPESFPLGLTVVTYVATDDSGNSATATQRITVQDTTKPVIVAPEDLILEAVGLLSMIQLDTATATDTVDSNVAITNDAPNSFPIGTTTITWTATDDSGNFATATQNVLVQDTTDPVLILQSYIIAEATGPLTVVDIGTATVTDSTGFINATNDAPASFPLGNTTVTWTARDYSGNVITAVQIVIVGDMTNPTIDVPDNILVEATGQLTGVNLGTAAATDLVDSNVAITNDAPDSFPVGNTLVTWTARDASQNTVTATQTITVRDTTDPSLLIPDDVVVEATGQLTGVNLGTAAATDLADPSVMITNDSPDSFPVGLSIVVYLAIDDSKNFVVGIQRVTVQDTVAPTIVAPEDLILEAVGLLSMIQLDTATATDTVDSNVAITNDAPNSFPIGTTTITWTATDDSGNFATATQNVLVQDTTDPVLILQSYIIAEATGPLTVVDIGTATVTDNTIFINATNDAPASFPLGNTTVTWTARDYSGNAVNVTQTVIVRDTTNPTITSPNSIVIEATGQLTDVNLGVITATDAVDSDVAITNDALESFPLGLTIVTYVATDDSGNSVTAMQKVTIQDTIKPVIVAPEDLILEAVGLLSMIQLDTATATDTVDSNVAITNDAPNLFPIGTTTITWTATDDSGNFATATQNVLVQDTTDPVLYIRTHVIVEATGPLTVVDLGSFIALDNIDSITATNDAPDLFSVGNTIVTWTAMDNSGNMVIATQLITIEDTIDPTIMIPDNIVAEATGQLTDVNLGIATATDIADPDVTITHNAPESFPLGLTIVTYVATDDSGNSVTARQKVTIQE